MRPKTVVLTRSAIEVVFHVSRPNVGDSLCILAVFMNRTPQVIGAITFQVAVTKVSGASSAGSVRTIVPLPSSVSTKDTAIASNKTITRPLLFFLFSVSITSDLEHSTLSLSAEQEKPPPQESSTRIQTESSMGPRE